MKVKICDIIMFSLNKIVCLPTLFIQYYANVKEIIILFLLYNCDIALADFCDYMNKLEQSCSKLMFIWDN